MPFSIAGFCGECLKSRRPTVFYLLLPVVPELLPERKFEENFDGAKRLDPVRAPSRPAPPEFEPALTLMAPQI